MKYENSVPEELKKIYDGNIIACLSKMIPGDYFYSHLKPNDYTFYILNVMNNSDEVGKSRKWWYHAILETMFCTDSRVYAFIMKIYKLDNHLMFRRVFPFIKINHRLDIKTMYDDCDKLPTEREIHEAGEHQVSLVLDSKFMGEFIAAGYNNEGK